MLFFAIIPGAPVSAETALPPLVFREAKLKGEDFLVLQATTAAVKLDEYWLGYDSSAALDAIEPEYRLAAVTLQPGESVVLVNDDAVPTCDARYTMDMPLDLAETKGTVGLWHRTGATSATISYNRIDSLSWTTTASGTANIVRPDSMEKGMVLPVWFRELAKGVMTWRVGDLSEDETGCVIKTTAGAALTSYVGAFSDDPSVEEDAASDEDNTSETTQTDEAYPQITELLPNPAGTGNDSTDEFIELYNPNADSFALGGYTLQTGTTTKHSYVFPAGTTLAPGYSVFFAEDTNLSLSNTSGQARLLTSDSLIVAETALYDGADDGVAWALVDGSWQWTTTPTPGASNVSTYVVATVKTAAVKSATSTKKTTTKKTTAKTAKATKTTKSATTTKGVASEATKPVRGIHPLVLVGILLGALGYGLYEHREDLANAFYQFRSNRTARRSNRR